MLYLWIFLIILGFALLVKGADWFVDGAAGVAEKCKLSPLVIGLTVVAFGTSAPELATSLTSAVRAYSDPSAVSLAFTNVAGSNITNILLILGISALIRPLPVKDSSLKWDLPVLLFVSALVVGLGVWGSALEWWDGLILLLVFAAYMAVLVRGARREQKLRLLNGEEAPPAPAPAGKLARWYYEMRKRGWFLAVLTLLGLGMVVGGSTLLVNSATEIARLMGVETGLVGLTIVAIGTSLPELVTSVIAACKNETDIAVGNILGSNLFNILLIAGASSLVHSLPFAADRMIDAFVAFGAAAVLYLFVLLGKKKLGRVGGALMLLLFAGYYVYLFVF